MCRSVYVWCTTHVLAVDCGAPPAVFQGSSSFSSTKMGSSVRYSCMQGTVMAGASSSTCTKFGTWSNAPPSCRIKYSTRNDNTYKNNDPGYKLYSG